MKTIYEIRRENGKALMKAHGMRLKDLAKKMGKDHTYISGHLGDRKSHYNIGARFARALEQVFNVPEGYLDNTPDKNAIVQLEKLGIAPPAEICQIPLLEWSQIDDFLAGKHFKIANWIYSAYPLPVGSFALTVEGDAMISLSPGQDSYPRNSIIFISIDRESSGKITPVIARTGKGYVFRILTNEGSQKYLKPINMQYPVEELATESDIIGVVKGQYISSKN